MVVAKYIHVLILGSQFVEGVPFFSFYEGVPIFSFYEGVSFHSFMKAFHCLVQVVGVPSLLIGWYVH